MGYEDLLTARRTLRKRLNAVAKSLGIAIVKSSERFDLLEFLHGPLEALAALSRFDSSVLHVFAFSKIERRCRGTVEPSEREHHEVSYAALRPVRSRRRSSRLLLPSTMQRAAILSTSSRIGSSVSRKCPVIRPIATRSGARRASSQELMLQRQKAATPNSTLKGPGEKLRPRLYSNSVVRYVREKRTANVILDSI